MPWLKRFASNGWIILLGVICILYILSPFDLLPDFVPVLGRLDDLGALVGTFLLIRRLSGLMSASQTTFGSQSQQRGAGAGERQQSAGAAPSETPASSPWEVLQVPPGATQEEIHTAYKTLLKQYHPDRVEHLGEELRQLAHQKTLAIQEAYARLKRR